MARWHCKGCGESYSENDADCIVDHVQACDYVDGAGEPVTVVVRWAEVRWHIAKVAATDLAAVTGSRPFAQLRGEASLNGGDRKALARYLTGLDGCPHTIDVNVSDVYPYRER